MESASDGYEYVNGYYTNYTTYRYIGNDDIMYVSNLKPAEEYNGKWWIPIESDSEHNDLDELFEKEL